MRLEVSILALSALASCGGSGSRDSFPLTSGDVWIRDVTVVSSERDAPLQKAHVVVRGDRIAFVDSASPEGDTAGASPSTSGTAP